MCCGMGREPVTKMLHQPLCEECTKKNTVCPFSTSDLPKLKVRNRNKWNFFQIRV